MFIMNSYPPPNLLQIFLYLDLFDSNDGKIYPSNLSSYLSILVAPLLNMYVSSLPRVYNTCQV